MLVSARFFLKKNVAENAKAALRLRFSTLAQWERLRLIQFSGMRSLTKKPF